MRDLVFLALIAGFFLLASGFIVVCDRIIGPDPTGLSDGGDDPVETSEPTLTHATVGVTR